MLLVTLISNKDNWLVKMASGVCDHCWPMSSITTIFSNFCGAAIVTGLINDSCSLFAV